MENVNISELKANIISEIKKNHYETLRYVLFNGKDRTPYAVHLFWEDGKFIVNSRDERSYVVGKSFEFNSFEEAKERFFRTLSLTIEISRSDIKDGYKADYPSPLWEE
ncbi:Imm59 family immunity protein [Listeria booriae]|uniref:Imm59 family immunity protein n=1 Tax=Listeria booriae TaxID=1552123 RepID=UPI0021AB83A7|nr:Imm59 family immunity protein [Listeria booriae]